MCKTRVVSFPRKHDVDITRGAGPWGNPFRIGRDGTREEVVAKFREHGEKTGLDKKARIELKGKVLGCACRVKPCHGDVYVE